MWDTCTHAEVARFGNHVGSMYGACFNPSGALMATCDDKMVRVWRVESRVCIARLSRHAQSVFAVAFSPDGLQLVSGGDFTIMPPFGIRTHGDQEVTEVPVRRTAV